MTKRIFCVTVELGDCSFAINKKMELEVGGALCSHKITLGGLLVSGSGLVEIKLVTDFRHGELSKTRQTVYYSVILYANFFFKKQRIFHFLRRQNIIHLFKTN